MLLCDLSLPSPEENLACDEALLEACEEGGGDGVLRFWESSRYFVVVGYSNAVGREVNQDFCRTRSIPILRRCTGGGTVLQGPGCLNYSLVLPINETGPLHSITATNDFVMERHQAAIATSLLAPVQKQGCTDLAIGGLKFCGNAQRRRKLFLLFHGAFLLNMDLELMEKALPMPSKQPGYRLGRSHKDFLMNLHVSAEQLKSALSKTWEASEPMATVPYATISRLVAEKYGQQEWNYKF